METYLLAGIGFAVFGYGIWWLARRAAEALIP